MAKATFQLPEEFLLKVSRLAERTDEIMPKVLQAGGEVVLARAKSNLRAVVGSRTKYKSRSTGELVSSLGLSPAKLDRNGNYNVKIGFAEPRRGGAGRSRASSNAKLGNIIEYGKHGQPAKPFLKPAKSQSKAAATEAMIRKLESEVDGT